MLKLSDLLPLVHGEFKVIVHKLHDVPHTLGGGVNGVFWEAVAVDNMIVSTDFCKDSPTSISGGGIARHIK